MPTYEYRCSNGHEFERFQRISEPPVETCPECGAGVERLFSVGGGLLFKGSGFYITDYRKDSYKKAAAAESGGGSGAGQDAPAKSEKKPETKGEGSSGSADKGS